MFALILVLHALFCLFLIVVILLQSGRGAGIGAAFGGASQTVFGPRGAASLLSRLTAGVAVAFMLSSITLAWLSSSSSSQMEKKVSALQEVKTKSTNVPLDEKPTEAGLPAAPAAEGPQATVPETDLPAGPGAAAEGQAPVATDAAPTPAATPAPAPKPAAAKPVAPKPAAPQAAPAPPVEAAPAPTPAPEQPAAE